MNKSIDWRHAVPGLAVVTGEPLKNRTTFKIGGPAAVILEPETTDEASEVLRVCAENGIKPFYLGNGSNVLAADGGYDGVILTTRRMTSILTDRGEPTLYADAGVLLSKLASYALGLGLTGLEFAAGIPGSVGGAVRMNAGAYGGEMAQVVERVDYLDRRGDFWVLEGNGCGFGYRRSVFCREPWLVTGVLFRLRKGDPAAIQARMAELNRQRREKQPLDFPSAGSTFKRPPELNGEPRYAAALIDQCGLKGLKVGGAQVSEKHAGFVINTGDATAADVAALMAEVRRRVKEQTGVELEPEVELLGMED